MTIISVSFGQDDVRRSIGTFSLPLCITLTVTSVSFYNWIHYKNILLDELLISAFTDRILCIGHDFRKWQTALSISIDRQNLYVCFMIHLYMVY